MSTKRTRWVGFGTLCVALALLPFIPAAATAVLCAVGALALFSLGGVRPAWRNTLPVLCFGGWCVVTFAVHHSSSGVHELAKVVASCAVCVAIASLPAWEASIAQRVVWVSAAVFGVYVLYILEFVTEYAGVVHPADGISSLFGDINYVAAYLGLVALSAVPLLAAAGRRERTIGWVLTLVGVAVVGLSYSRGMIGATLVALFAVAVFGGRWSANLGLAAVMLVAPYSGNLVRYEQRQAIAAADARVVAATAAAQKASSAAPAGAGSGMSTGGGQASSQVSESASGPGQSSAAGSSAPSGTTPQITVVPPAKPTLTRVVYLKGGYTSMRLAIYKQAFRMWLAHPIFGVGIGNFRSTWDVDASAANFPPSLKDVNHAHDQYLQSAAEEGLPGLLLFAWACWSILYSLWRRRTEPRSIGLLAGFGALLIFFLVETPLYNSAMSIAFWAMAGFALRSADGGRGLATASATHTPA